MQTTMTVQIDGMSCEHCVRAVKTALGGVPGLEVGEVKVGTAVVRFDPATADATKKAIRKAIDEEGFELRGMS